MAGAGAGAIAIANANATGNAMPDDTAVLEKIRGFFTLFEKQSDTLTGKLELTIQAINGKAYTTTFRCAKDPRFPGNIEMSNDCIELGFEKWGEVFIADTSIEANDKDESCFHPRLSSNARNAPELTRTTTTDILQVLKLKLILAHGNIPEISIRDSAIIDSVIMTPFRVLRGEMPFYQKYGYTSEKMEHVQHILKDMTLQSANRIIHNIFPSDFPPDVRNISERLATLKQQLRTLYTEEFASAVPKGNSSNVLKRRLIDLLKRRLPFERENTPEYRNFSQILLNILFYKYKLYPAIFVFNPDSAEWAKWKRRVVITDATFSLDAAKTKGGAHRSRRTCRGKRYRKHTKTRKGTIKRA